MLKTIISYKLAFNKMKQTNIVCGTTKLSIVWNTIWISVALLYLTILILAIPLISESKEWDAAKCEVTKMDPECLISRCWSRITYKSLSNTNCTNTETLYTDYSIGSKVDCHSKVITPPPCTILINVAKLEVLKATMLALGILLIGFLIVALFLRLYNESNNN